MSAAQPLNPAQWSHGNASGAVQSIDSDANPYRPEAGSNTDGKDAIREGKQKAKEALAAAGVNASGSLAPAFQSNMSNGNAQANGTSQLSRKRSRDGTRLPLDQPSASNDAPPELRRQHNDILLDRYIQRDMIHGAALNDQAERLRDLIKSKEMEKEFYAHDVAARRRTDPGSIYGYGYAGYGNGSSNEKSRISYTADRRPPKGRRCLGLRISRKDNSQQSEQHEELVPIRLDIELDKLRLRDTFTWNLHEKLVSQEFFTDHLLEDLKIPPEALPEVSRQVKAEMQDQIHSYYPHIIVEDGPLEPGKPYHSHKDDELRIQIKLNITIGRITLVDQFEWDINNPLNSAEEFARQMAYENALSGEFTTAIAHSIREQSQLYTKSLYLTNHCFDGRPVEDPDLRASFLHAPIHSAFRPVAAQKDFMPFLYEMSEAELERTETSMMRESRAQKRQLNRRGGPALPDLKDRQRTVRSLLVHSVIPGAVDTFETTGIPKTRRGGRGGRRAPRPDGDVESDDLESDDSGAESPAPSAIVTTGGAGTTRTRGMRGAATAATAAMRALGRSGTPDSQFLQPATALRTSVRNSSTLRDEPLPDAEDSLIVQLRIPKAKFKAWWEACQAKKRASAYPLSGYASQPLPAILAAQAAAAPGLTPKAARDAAGSTPQPNGSLGVGRTSRASSAGRSGVQYDAKGGVDMDVWPAADEMPPPPPPWLTSAITFLRAAHPTSDFAPLMKPYVLDAATGAIGRPTFQPGEVPTPGKVFQFLPRIRCNDCPGKVYTAIPGKVREDFAVHLRNRGHLETVARREQGV